MLTFRPLVLSQRAPVAEDAVCLTFRAPSELADAYRFEAGQHLAVRATLGGRELRRTYSIVSPVGGELKIGVRVQGEMSRYLASQLAVGDALEILTPTGRFKPAIEPGRAKHYVALAAGSGITPILSIVATLLAAEPLCRVLLVYANRTIARTMFLEELLALKNRYLARLTEHFVMSREPQEVALFNGRLDAARLRELARTEFDPGRVDEFFICGPGSMARELGATLRELGAVGKIHVEHFAVDRGPAAARAQSVESLAIGVAAAAAAATAAPVPRSAANSAEITIKMDGRRRSFSMARDRLVLESAEAAGFALPYSCRSGVCSTCRARVVAGSVTMDRNQALEDWEVQAGFVLCCQARPASARVELSYDEK